jgi:putative membrane protein
MEATTLACALGGVCLGTLSGLTPGLHANNFALALAAAAPAVSLPPTALGVAMVAAGVAHTFLDVVPSLALGVPDAAMAASALPGHRLVLAGRGREALRLSALGSGLAVVAAVPVAVPLTAAMGAVYPTLSAWLPAVLALVVAALLASERSRRGAAAGVVALALSTGLGALTLDLPVGGAASVGGVLTPLFAGLFGAPVLLDALDGDGVPEQGDATISSSPRSVGAAAAAGTGAGALVGYLPGVSAGVAGTLALPAVPGDAARGYVVATSGANTAVAAFALFALVDLGATRTGVTVAVSEAGVPAVLAPLLAAAVLSAACSFLLVPRLGDAYLRVVGRADPRLVCAVAGAVLVALSVAFAGVAGVAVLLAATALGLLAPRLGARRVYLMGVLLGPLALGV